MTNCGPEDQYFKDLCFLCDDEDDGPDVEFADEDIAAAIEAFGSIPFYKRCPIDVDDETKSKLDSLAEEYAQKFRVRYEKGEETKDTQERTVEQLVWPDEVKSDSCITSGIHAYFLGKYFDLAALNEDRLNFEETSAPLPTRTCHSDSSDDEFTCTVSVEKIEDRGRDYDWDYYLNKDNYLDVMGSDPLKELGQSHEPKPMSEKYDDYFRKLRAGYYEDIPFMSSSESELSPDTEEPTEKELENSLRFEILMKRGAELENEYLNALLVENIEQSKLRAEMTDRLNELRNEKRGIVFSDDDSEEMQEVMARKENRKKQKDFRKNERNRRRAQAEAKRNGRLNAPSKPEETRQTLESDEDSVENVEQPKSSSKSGRNVQKPKTDTPKNAGQNVKQPNKKVDKQKKSSNEEVKSKESLPDSHASKVHAGKHKKGSSQEASKQTNTSSVAIDGSKTVGPKSTNKPDKSDKISTARSLDLSKESVKAESSVTSKQTLPNKVQERKDVREEPSQDKVSVKTTKNKFDTSSSSEDLEELEKLADLKLRKK